MAQFRVIDEHVISEAEYRERQSQLTSFLIDRAAGKASKTLVLSGERTLSKDMPTAAPSPIGRGLPLTILIREIYTGEYPHGGIFNSDGDIAVVSAVKNYDVFNASTRALNFLVPKVKPKARLHRPAPFTDGTSLVAYSPAIMTDSLTVGFELAVASFPQEFLTSVSQAFNSIAGIPLLLPYSGYLLAAGELTKLAADVGHALFDGVKFSVTDAINFDIWGTEPTPAGFRIISTSEALPNYKYTDAGGLVDSQGNKYAGNAPYVVVSLDGKPRDNLKDFAPTVASAAVLQRYFQIQSGGQAAVGAIVEGLKFVSDSKYRDQAIALQAKLAQAGLSPDDS